MKRRVDLLDKAHQQQKKSRILRAQREVIDMYVWCGRALVMLDLLHLFAIGATPESCSDSSSYITATEPYQVRFHYVAHSIGASNRVATDTQMPQAAKKLLRNHLYCKHTSSIKWLTECPSFYAPPSPISDFSTVRSLSTIRKGPCGEPHLKMRLPWGSPAGQDGS